MDAHTPRLLALPLALLALALAGGCGSATEEPGGPLPTARYAIPSDTATASPTAGAATDVEAATESANATGPAAMKAFVRGMAAYCTSYYSGLSEAEESFPQSGPTADIAYSQAAGDAVAATEAQLDGLHPPAALAQTFARFVKVSHELTHDRMAITGALTKTGDDGPAGDAYDRAVQARRPLAHALHAPICDGELPPGQQAAVVEVVRRVETGADSQVVCRDLVTPGFLDYTWATSADPVAACVLTRDALAAGRPHDIEVVEVSGADGISATVSYTLIGGCACGDDAVARVHFVDSTWRVASISD